MTLEEQLAGLEKMTVNSPAESLARTAIRATLQLLIQARNQSQSEDPDPDAISELFIRALGEEKAKFIRPQA